MNGIVSSCLVARARASALVGNRRGATAIEYGLIAAGIAIAIVAVVATVGGDLTSKFQQISTGLQPSS